MFALLKFAIPVITDIARKKGISVSLERPIKNCIKFEKNIGKQKTNSKGTNGKTKLIEKDGTKHWDKDVLQKCMAMGKTILATHSCLKIYHRISSTQWMGEKTFVNETPTTIKKLNEMFPGDGGQFTIETKAAICDDKMLEYCLEKGYNVVKCVSWDDINNCVTWIIYLV